MPKKIERSLKRTARKRRYGKARTRRYVFGTMRRMGWKPKRERKRRKRR